MARCWDWCIKRTTHTAHTLTDALRRTGRSHACFPEYLKDTRRSIAKSCIAAAIAACCWMCYDDGIRVCYWNIHSMRSNRVFDLPKIFKSASRAVTHGKAHSTWWKATAAAAAVFCAFLKTYIVSPLPPPPPPMRTGAVTTSYYTTSRYTCTLQKTINRRRGSYYSFFFVLSPFTCSIYLSSYRTKALAAAAARCGQKTIRRLRARRLSAGDIRFT